MNQTLRYWLNDIEVERVLPAAEEEVILAKGMELGGQGVTVNVEFSWGATEVKPPVLADGIVEADGEVIYIVKDMKVALSEA